MDPRSQNITDDFKTLEKSSETLTQFLRVDEQSPDLLDQLCQRPDANGSHRYYVEPYKSINVPVMERNKFIPFPPEIANQYKNVESASFMGILPEINRVWVTVDNILYLWNYNRPSEPYIYDGISEVIVSVALTAPKPGIFLDTVRYLLVVATPVDVSVLAVCSDEGFETIRLSPTSYTLPSDNTTMVKIVGCQSGRIFMAGSDFNVYELEYSLSENPWSSIFGGEAVRKCRKVNHFATNWKLEHIVPPLLRSFLVKEDSFADLTVDNSRNILYGISIRGCLNAFYLGVNGSMSHLFANGFDLFNETRNFLNNSPFAPEDLKRYFSEDLVASGFSVLNIYPISVLESKRVHAVVILANGTRIYISLQGIRGYYEPDIDYQNGPSGVTVVGIRAPPPTEAINLSKTPQDSNGADQGFLPTFDAARKLNVTTSFYSRGTCLYALEKSQQPDELLSLFEDNIIRGVGTFPTFPSMREGMSIDNFAFAGRGFNGKVFDIKELSPDYSDPVFSRLVSMNYHSLTATDNILADKSRHRGFLFDHQDAPVSSWFGKSDQSSSQQAYLSLISTDNILSPSILSNVSGLEIGNSMNGVVLGDLAWQHLPVQSYFSKRQFAILVNDGIVIFTKSRPADALLDGLLRNDRDSGNSFDRLFRFYGEQQAATMCLGLIIGLPGDAGSNSGLESIINPRPLTLDSRLCSTLLEVVVNELKKASFRATLAPVGIEADSRVVATRAASDFQKSTFHDAVYTIASRLLRPIWLRAVVENASIASCWSLGLIESIRVPIESLKFMMLQKYRAIIESDGKNSSRRSTVFGERGQTIMQKEKELALQAKALDDESIRNLYLLLSRSSHLLSLISVFVSARNAGGINLAALNGFTFRSIVTLSHVHEQVKKCINDLIDALIRNRDNDLLSRITKNLSDNCYHYFSAGDVHALKASKLFDDIRKLSAEGIVGEDIHDLMRDCAVEFRLAAGFWNSPEYIVGDNSELRRACSWLVNLNEWGREAVVDVCLTVADNFIADPARRTQRQLQRERRWDANLYHGGSVITEEVRQLCLMECYRNLASAITSYGSNQILVGGGIVNWNNNSLTLSREKSGEHVKEMIELAVSRCQDRDFHELLYSSLLASRSEALLRVKSQYIENFLRIHDPKLLYKYYMLNIDGRQPQYRLATELMRELASEDVERSIEDRIDCFNRALESCNQLSVALMNPNKSGQNNASGLRTNEELTRELNDLIEVAHYQREVRDILKNALGESNSSKGLYDSNTMEQYQLLERDVAWLSNGLVDISQLFKLCADYKVWNYNLILLHTSRTNDATLAEKFWKSYLYRLVPLQIQDSGVRSADMRKIAALFHEKREFVEVDEHEQCYESFEDFDSWLPKLRSQVINLGKRLEADRNSVHFPLVMIVDELEYICAAIRLWKYDSIPLDWVSTSLRELKIPYSSLVEAYFQIWHTRCGDNFIVDFLAGSISALLLNWISDATRQMDDQNDDKRFCLHAVRSQQMDGWIKTLAPHVKSLSTVSYDTESRKETSALTRKNLELIKKELKRLDMIFSTEYRR